MQIGGKVPPAFECSGQVTEITRFLDPTGALKAGPNMQLVSCP